MDDPLKKDPVENAGQESLSRSLPEATKNVANDELTNEPAVKSCSIVTASRELLIKKDPATEVTN